MGTSARIVPEKEWGSSFATTARNSAGIDLQIAPRKGDTEGEEAEEIKVETPGIVTLEFGEA